MCPASAPGPGDKMFPAAVRDDQEMLANAEDKPIVLGPGPYSSPDPTTDGIRMLPLEDGTSAYEARVEAATVRMQGEAAADGDYSKMNKAELKSLAEERDLTVEGTKKDDYLAALRADDARDMKASDFKDRVTAATTQEELDEAAELYAASEASYSSVEAAIEKKQGEIDEAADGGGQ